MESSDEELNQPDEVEWIERQKHELILRKYRLNTQRIIREYQEKIQQQNREIETLKKEVKRQKFIIDTFANETNETVQDTTPPSLQIEAISLKTDPTADLESESVLYLESDVPNLGHNVKVENDESSLDATEQEEEYTKTINGSRPETTLKKSSLLSIQIQPNVHTDIYICDECNKPMSSRRVLVKHKRMVHCVQKKFVCDYCSKAFCVRDGLKRHLRIHTGEKPFVCRGCQKGFNQSGNMRIHEKTCKKYLRQNGYSSRH